MITPEHVEAALAKLNDEEHAAQVYITEMRAENEMELIYDKLFQDAQGSIEMKKSIARSHPAYQEAKELYIIARGDMKAYEAGINGARSIIAAYQTQSANARQSEWIK
jgi:hypothetical protein